MQSERITSFQEAARLYFLACEARVAAKAAHRAAGHCEFGERGSEKEPCYHATYRYAWDGDTSEWCDVCKTRQPLWNVYHAAAHAEGAARTRFLRLGRLEGFDA